MAIAGSTRAYLCECATRSCRLEVRLTELEYSDLRAHGLRLIAAAHDVDEAKVCARGPGWVAVGQRRYTLGRDITKAQVRVDVIRWCPSCREETLPGSSRQCLFCGTRTDSLADKGAAA